MVSSKAFLSLYLKEIGVHTPISSFLSPAPGAITTTTIPNTAPTYIASAMPAAEKQLEVAEAEPIPLHPTLNSNNTMSKVNNIDDLKQQAILCQRCVLAESRSQVVFGSGATTADLVFIGDAPGRDEDIAGLPFVGRSGTLFAAMLQAIGFTRDEVYFMNGVQCRPLHNRDPKPDEFAACEHWLSAQLDLLQPRLICLLGRVAAQSLLNTEASLSELRAEQHSFRGVPVLVLDHPSYLLRAQQHKRRAWQDLIALKQHFNTLKTA